MTRSTCFSIRLFLALGLAIVLALSIVSCSKTEFDEDRDPDLAPWAELPVEVAIKTNTLRVYTLTGLKFDGKTRGDSTLIVFPNGETMLVDTGVTGMGKYIGQSLNALGIDHIDHLVITHAHNDHAFGVLYGSLLSYVTVGQCYFNGIYNSEWERLDMVEVVMNAYGIPLSVLTRGDVLEIGGVTVTVISPSAEYVGTTQGTNATNPMSLVMKFQFGDTSLLMTGDMHDENEYECIELYGDFLDCDVLKIAHHGLSSSSTKEFLEAVSPKIAFCIGSGSIPSKLYTDLALLGAKSYMDTIDGYMRIVLDGKDVTMTTSLERQTDYYETYDKIAELKLQQAQAQAE